MSKHRTQATQIVEWFYTVKSASHHPNYLAVIGGLRERFGLDRDTAMAVYDRLGHARPRNPSLVVENILRKRYGDRARTRALRGLWTVDYQTVRRRPGGVGLLWHVGVVRARFRADAIEAIRRLEARRGLTIRDVTVASGDGGLFAQGYPRSRVVDANAWLTRTR